MQYNERIREKIHQKPTSNIKRKEVATMTTEKNNTNTLFAERLTMAMKRKKWRSCDLAAAADISRARVSQYTHGKYTPAADGICRLADVLGVSASWLMGLDDDPHVFEDQVPTDELPEGVTTAVMHRFPLLGDIACGQPTLATQEFDAYATSSDNTPADFCLLAKGDSMIGAKIEDGDLVFIKSCDMVNNGDIAAVVIDDEATLKRVYYYPQESKLILTAENARYAPLVYMGEELNFIRILGKAVAVQSKLK